MNSSVIIIGAGGFALNVANVVLGSGMSIIAFVDDAKSGDDLLEIPIITKKQCVDNYQKLNLIVAIGDNYIRERVSLEYKSSLPKAKFPTLIHPTAVVGVNTKIGEGTVVMPLVNVGPNSIVGNFCILNTLSSISHDCEMKSYSSIAPRVVTGGNVIIGHRSAISIGSTIKHNIGIGKDVIIGANSYVNKQVSNNVVAYGSPCKFVRKRNIGDSYL